MSLSLLMGAYLTVSSVAERSAEESPISNEISNYSIPQPVFGLFLALTSVEKEQVHCRASIAGADLFTEVCLPASSYSSEVGTKGVAKFCMCLCHLEFWLCSSSS